MSAGMDDVAALTTEALRALLHTGLPGERLRAAWQLGLRLGADGADTIAAGTRGELHPGVRRHLVVVLAGLGERHAVWAMAAGDPAAEVRAVACQCLAMSAVPGDDTPWATLIDRLANDASASVRRACAAFLPDEVPGAVRSAIVGAGGDQDLEVRRAVVDCLLAWAWRGHAEATSALLYRAVLEDDTTLREALLDFGLRHEGGGPLLARASGSEASAATMLASAKARGLRFSWQALQPLVARGSASLDSLMRDVLDDSGGDEADAWLLRAMLRPWCDESDGRHGGWIDWAPATLLERRHAGALVGEASEQTRALARRVCEAMATERKRGHAEHLLECDAEAHGAECEYECWVAATPGVIAGLAGGEGG